MTQPLPYNPIVTGQPAIVQSPNGAMARRNKINTVKNWALGGLTAAVIAAGGIIAACNTKGSEQPDNKPAVSAPANNSTTTESPKPYVRNYPNASTYHIDIKVGEIWYAEKDVPKDAKPTLGRFYIQGNALGYAKEDVKVEFDIEALPTIKQALENARKTDYKAGKMPAYSTDYRSSDIAQIVSAMPDMDTRGPAQRITQYDADKAHSNSTKGKQGLTK